MGDSFQNLPSLMIRQCRAARGRAKVADSTGAKMTGGSLLLRSLIFRRLLLREVFASDEQYVGLLLPPSAGAVLANAATTLARRIAVNLNYSVTSDILNHCIRTCGIRHVLTSRRFMEKMNFSVEAELVYLEDLRERVRLADKLTAAIQAFAMPARMLERQLGLDKIRPDDVLTIIFTSGSTGMPKGVMLTYENVGSNTAAVDAVVHLRDDDVICAVLPFFHSFGYTVTLWTVLTLPPKGVYHYSPLDAKIVGKLCREHRATVLLSTPTFLRGYMKRCEKEDFAALDVVVLGAEKVPADLFDAFEQKFGVRPVEGYGTTELSPLVSVNVPPSRTRAKDALEVREGSVGRPVPGVRAKIVHPETGAEMPIGESGMLLIAGPNVMTGYLQQDEATKAVLRDGWYTTGDIGYIDMEGFIYITGRESRFSKIGGEMVPHIPIEEAIQRIVAAGDDEVTVAVTALPDERKGERLIVLHRPLSRTPEDVSKALAAEGFPNLWIPSPDSFFEVEQIPLLGSGKLDLKQLKDLAGELSGKRVTTPKG
jgi:acyl-[acyl-carrier-protein]-phospholipid O-acyltransferase/long-chain-fatty-acid--[acyl-carrier-protein] ligase